MCANVIPTIANTSQRQSSPRLPTASNAATRPATTVIGSTAARVTTIQRVMASTGPSGGGLVVRRAYPHDRAHDFSREPAVSSGIDVLASRRHDRCRVRLGVELLQR